MSNEHAAMQAFFDKSTKGIIAQGKPSRANGSCLYRLRESDEVLACAIGQCLTDEQIVKYKIEEGLTPGPSGPGKPGFSVHLVWELLPGVDYQHAIAFMGDLQGCHDSHSAGETFIPYFKASANEVARRYGLKPIST